MVGKVGIKAAKDSGTATIGHKRNQLLKSSNAEYVSFFDDDDMPLGGYIKQYHYLKNKPDCLSFKGVITFDGGNKKTFIHEFGIDRYYERDRVYYRPPNHLNVIKRSIAVQVPFPEKDFGEDTDWAMELRRKNLVKRAINTGLGAVYHYDYKTNKNV